MMGILGDADGDETLTINVYFGSQLVGTSGALAIDGNTSCVVSGRVKIEAAGASVAGDYGATFINGAVAAASGARFTAFDTTATHAFTIKGDWGGTTDAQDSVILYDLNLSVNSVD
jgi:hypothetical protein